MYLFHYVCVPHTCLVSVEVRGISNYRCLWDAIGNLGPLQEHQVLLTTGPSCQSKCDFYFLKKYLPLLFLFMFMLGAYVSECHMCTEARRCRLPWGRSYRWLRAACVDVGTELRSSEIATVLWTTDPFIVPASEVFCLQRMILGLVLFNCWLLEQVGTSHSNESKNIAEGFKINMT